MELAVVKPNICDWKVCKLSIELWKTKENERMVKVLGGDRI